VIAAAALLATAAWLAVVAAPRERARFVGSARAQREAMAEERRAALDRWLAAGLGDARLLASYPTVVHLAGRDAASPAAPGVGPPEHLTALLAGFLAMKGYRDAAALDRGLSLVGSVPASFVLTPECVALARRCLAGGAPLVEAHLHDGAPAVEFAAPVRDAAGRPVGVACLVEDPSDWLYPALAHHPRVSSSGETLLVRRSGEDALYISPLRHGEVPPFALRLPVAGDRLGAAAALAGDEGFGRYLDYRGVAVFAAPRALANAPWGLVVKVDETEVLAPFRRWLASAAALVAAFALAFGGVVYGLWRREGDRRALALAQSRAQLARLLDGASDAVFSLTRDGVIRDANRRAAEIYGYSLEELRGMPVASLRRPEARAAVPGMLAAVAAAGHLRLETEHLRKDGSVFPVEVSASSGGGADDGGVLAIATDISERRRSEDQIRRLNRMLRTISEINQLVVREGDPDRLLAESCRIVVELGGLALVWVGRLDRESGEVRPVAAAGAATGALAQLQLRADDSELGRLPTGVAVREQRRVVVDDWDSDATVAPPPAWAAAVGLRAVAALPLRGGGFGQGSFTAYATEPRFFDTETVALLEELVADLAFALDAIAARRALEKQDGLLRDVSRMARIGGWELDPRTGEGAWTEEVARIHGVDPAAPTNAAIGLAFYAGESRARIEAAIRDAVEKGTPYDLELELSSADGVRKWVRTIGLPHSEDGRVVRLAGTFQDVSERKRAEEALNESERRYRELVESANSAILRWRPDGTVTYCNEFAASFFGYAVDELVGRPLSVLVPAADSAGRDLSDLVRDVAREPERFVNVANENVRRDGTRVWLTWTNKAVRGAGGEIVEILSIGSDITPGKRAEEALQLAHARLRRLVDSNVVGIVIAGTDGEIVEANDYYLAMVGFTREELERGEVDWRAITPPEWLPADEKALAELAERGTCTPYEKEYRRRDGSRVRALLADTLLPGREPQIAAFVLDLSERARLEGEVSFLNRRLEELIAGVQALAAARDLDDVAAVVRTSARRLVGADGATFVLRDGDHCRYVDEDAIAPLWKGSRFPLRQCISGWAMLDREAIVLPDIYADPRVPHEAYRPTFVKSLVVAPIRSTDALGAIGAYWSATHVAGATEVRLLQTLADAAARAIENVRFLGELEARVAERTRDLVAANQELEAFSYSVSHDLRAPLRAIDGFSRIVDEDYGGRLDDEGRRLLGVVRDNTRRMGQLIDDLLAFSRIGRAEMHGMRVDMAALARGAFEEVGDPAARSRVDLVLGGLPEARGDRALLRQVWANLLANALKFSSGRESPRIVVSGRRDGDRVVYEVADNGVGFDMRYADKLFGVFQRLHGMREFPGTGVGLALVKRVVARHGGEVWAAGEVDAGATFGFSLPAEKEV